MDRSKQLSITDKFKNQAANTIEFIFGCAFLLLTLFAFGRLSQTIADNIRPNHSFENEYLLQKIVPYFIPFICGVTLWLYSFIAGHVRDKKFQLRSKVGWYVFLASFRPAFLVTVFFFVSYFYLIDESALIETPVEEFSYASFSGNILFGMISIGLSISLRNKYCTADKIKTEIDG